MCRLRVLLHGGPSKAEKAPWRWAMLPRGLKPRAQSDFLNASVESPVARACQWLADSCLSQRVEHPVWDGGVWAWGGSPRRLTFGERLGCASASALRLGGGPCVLRTMGSASFSPEIHLRMLGVLGHTWMSRLLQERGDRHDAQVQVGGFKATLAQIKDLGYPYAPA